VREKGSWGGGIGEEAWGTLCRGDPALSILRGGGCNQ